MNQEVEQQPYILVADDDPLMLKSLQIILRPTGHRVVAVLDGEAAWQQMNQEPPVLAFLDVMMGKINGLDLVRRIRSSDHLKHLKVFLLTARAMPQERKQGLIAGADEYITKPFANRELLDLVRNVLDDRVPSSDV